MDTHSKPESPHSATNRIILSQYASSALLGGVSDNPINDKLDFKTGESRKSETHLSKLGPSLSNNKINHVSGSSSPLKNASSSPDFPNTTNTTVNQRPLLGSTTVNNNPDAEKGSIPHNKFTSPINLIWSFVTKKRTYAISFRSLVVIIMAALVSLVAPLSWYFTNAASVSTAISFGQQLQAAILDEVVSALKLKFQACEQLNQLQSINWQSGTFTMTNRSFTDYLLYTRSQEYATLISTQAFASIQGDLWGYHVETTSDPFITYKWDAVSGTYTQYQLNQDGQIQSIVRTEPNFNCTQTDWFSKINLSLNTSKWLPAQSWFGDVQIYNVQPARDRLGQLLGIAISSIDFDGLSHLLQTFSKNDLYNTNAYLIEVVTGLVIGASTSVSFQNSDNDGKRTAYDLAQSKEDPIFTSIYNYLNNHQLSNFTGIKSMTTSVDSSVDKVKGSWVVSIQRITWHEIDWVIMQAISQSEVLGSIPTAGYNLLGVVIVIVIIAIILVIVLANNFISSLNEITLVMNRAINAGFMAIDQVGLMKSGNESLIRESGRIQEAFYSMMNAFIKAAASSRALKMRSSVNNLSHGNNTTNNTSYAANSGSSPSNSKSSKVTSFTPSLPNASSFKQ